MGTNQGPGVPPGPGFGGRFEDVWERIEAELRQAVAYVNDNVAPVVRKESVTAMRSVADALKNLADRIEQKGPQG